MNISENNLEATLIKATIDPKYCHQFYKYLIRSEVLIINQFCHPGNKHKASGINGNEFQIISVRFNGRRCIPFFTSLNKLRAAIKKDREVGYLQIKAPEFFRIVPDMDVILNPGSQYTKEFTKSEITSILDGSIFKNAEENSQLLVGHPVNYPTELTNRLTLYFQKINGVKKAYLALILNPGSNIRAQTLIGLEISGNPEDIMAGCTLLAKTVAVPDPPVNFKQIKNAAERNKYFKNIKPFYKRKILTLFG